MGLEELRQNWERFGETDPLWAILAIPGQEGNRWSPEQFFRSGQDEIAALVGKLAPLGLPRGRGRALDFGCGVGRLSQALAGHFDEVVGVDIAASMVDLARRFNRHGDRCRFVHNTSDDLGVLNGATFDLIYSSYVLQHMAPALARSYIEEFLRLLAPGGVAVFQLPIRQARTPVVVGRALASPLRLQIVKLVASRTLARLPGRGGGDTPVMEMHATPEGEVRRWVSDAGGHTLLVSPIFAAFSAYAGLKWDHRCYFVARAP